MELTEVVTEDPPPAADLGAEAPSVVTKVFVEGICCASEAVAINSILGKLPGVLQVRPFAVTTIPYSQLHSLTAAVSIPK
jgi:hypothetical protein